MAFLDMPIGPSTRDLPTELEGASGCTARSAGQVRTQPLQLRPEITFNLSLGKQIKAAQSANRSLQPARPVAPNASLDRWLPRLPDFQIGENALRRFLLRSTRDRQGYFKFATQCPKH